jgi:hypothetical protein
MKRFRLSILSPKGDNAMSGQKNPWKKALTRTVWLAPTLGAASTAVLLILFSIVGPLRSQTVNTTVVQTSTNTFMNDLNQGLISLLPEAVLDPTTDPPGNFHNVTPGQFDPAHTNLVQGAWLNGIGCPTNAFTFDGSTTTQLTDTACPIGDPNDQRNQGLLLVKTGPTTNFAAAVAELINVKGITLTELGYDIRKSGADGSSPLGSHCGAGAPRFDVVTTDGVIHFVGCNSSATPPTTAMAGLDLDWVRLRWVSVPLVGITAFPTPIAPTDVVSRIVIVFDEGQDASGGPDQFGAAILDNIDVNGTLVGRGPVNAN